MHRAVVGLVVAACLLWGGHAKARRFAVIRCTDGQFPASLGRYWGCDVDGSADGVCTFTFPTGLACLECPTTQNVEVPLNGRRAATVENPARYYVQRLRCRRAP
jgi:hypothetical protein